MKYCFYCGKQVDKDETVCPFCHENISILDEKKKFHAFVDCIKCGSKNVEYSISMKNKNGIVHEEQTYRCKDCNKEFKDKNRLGHSFSNRNQIVLGDNLVKIIKFLLIIAIVIFLCIKCDIAGRFKANTPKVYDYVLDCKGLPKAELINIYNEYKADKKTAKEKYHKKAFIFEGKIFDIHKEDGEFQLESDFISPTIYFNKDEKYKLQNFNDGDTIKICGIVKFKKTLISVPLHVENATVITNK